MAKFIFTEIDDSVFGEGYAGKSSRTDINVDAIAQVLETDDGKALIRLKGDLNFVATKHSYDEIAAKLYY